MAKIKDWSLDHPGQSTGTMTPNSLQAYLANVAFTKNMHRDIEEYLIRQEREKITQKASKVVTRKIVVSRADQNRSDWAYDEMIDNRLTVAL